MIIYRKAHRVLVQGITGKQGTFWAEKMIECGTRVVGGVNPKRAGETHIGVPVFASAAQAMAKAPYEAAVMFIPPSMAKEAALDAIAAGVKLLVVLTEHIPAHDVMAILLAGRRAGTSIVGPNTAGEVYIKGPTVMRGYHNRPEATADVLSVDGWLRTGDIGEMDAEGNLRIVDRAKDLIIRGGYNVYPSEVEAVLYEHPDIVEAAVVGIPHEHYGEEVAAVVVVRPGSPQDGPAITAWSRERLSAYKIPRIVQFVDELPKGSTGKLLKRAIDREPLVKIAADQ